MVSPSPSAIAGWMTNANPSLPHANVPPGAPPGLVQPPNTGTNTLHLHVVCLFNLINLLCFFIYPEVFFSFEFLAAFLKHARTPSVPPGMDYQSADSEHLMKRMRVGQPDEVQALKKFI